MNEATPLIIKLEHGNDVQKSQEGLKINRIVSSISPYHFICLIGAADNKINPRIAKENGITADIRETLSISPNLFFLMSKGILLATESCKIFQRGRICITTLGDREGIMDGGHNVLAIAQYLVTELFPLEKMFKTWADCKKFWRENEAEIISRFNARGGNSAFPFCIPLEIIFPSEEDGGLDDYYQTISQICTARNTNVQLKQATQDNQVGIYDVLKDNLSCVDQIVWKSGQSGEIKVEDIVGMAVIPLLFLQESDKLPKHKSIRSFNPISIYSQKSKCVDFYGDVLKHPDVSKKVEDKYVLHNPLVRSALTIVEDFIKAFDKLYLEFPNIYNKNTGKFGRISAVIQKKRSVPFLSSTQTSEYNYPPAFYIPLFCGLRKLLYIDEITNTLKWKKNPADDDFSFEQLDCSKYIEMVKFLDYNPIKVGKASMMYLEGNDIFTAFLYNRK